MRIVINTPIDITEWEGCEGWDEFIKDFRECSIWVKDGYIIEQKIDLDEEKMNDIFFTYLEQLNIPVTLEMYDIGRYTFVQE